MYVLRMEYFDRILIRNRVMRSSPIWTPGAIVLIIYSTFLRVGQIHVRSPMSDALTAKLSPFTYSVQGHFDTCLCLFYFQGWSLTGIT